MPLGVSYMGTKRQLAVDVAHLVDDVPAGPFLDLFSGMCAVGSAVGRGRAVWANDLQHFANTVAQAHFCSQGGSPTTLDAADMCKDAFQSHSEILKLAAGSTLTDETQAIETGDIDALQGVTTLSLETNLLGVTHTLFSSRYAGSYFSLRQCIQIDALRYALDTALANGRLSEEGHRWLVLAMCKAMSRCSSSTGHFAQPLRPKFSNFRKWSAQRRRSFWREWLSVTDGLAPLGSRTWRLGNKAIRMDANLLLDQLAHSPSKPRVVYADPPYTKDQYSRFYHLYETMVLYDYPDCVGTGRYRSDRATSDFSLRASAPRSLRRLVASCAEIGADLILSYPVEGVLPDSREMIPKMFREAFGRKPTEIEFVRTHSTMGASKGPAQRTVIEVLYHGRA